MFLVVTRNFPPEIGGMQNLMEGLSNALLNHGPVKVFAETHDEDKDYDQNSKLNIERVDKFKANCNYKTTEQNTGWFHTDYDDGRKNEMTTSILYMNTNNGGTKFEDGTFVNSVSNRMVTFDCSIKHAPVSCTDSNRRIVVNINYTKI